MTSPSFQILEDRVEVLRNLFLPAQWDPLGKYSTADCEKAIAFTVLAHAEIESYLEKVTVAFADHHEKQWATARLVSRCLMGLVRNAFTSAPAQANKAVELTELIELGKQAFGNYARMQNHGVKEENMRNLLTPIGISFNQLPATLVPELDSLGTTRGSYAHQTGFSRTLVNPEDEHRAIAGIIGSLASLDVLLTV